MFPKLLKISYDNLMNKGFSREESRNYLAEKYPNDVDIIEEIYLGHNVVEDIAINSNKVVDVTEFMEEDDNSDVEYSKLSSDDIAILEDADEDIEEDKGDLFKHHNNGIYAQAREFYIKVKDKSTTKDFMIAKGLQLSTAESYYSTIVNEVSGKRRFYWGEGKTNKKTAPSLYDQAKEIYRTNKDKNTVIAQLVALGVKPSTATAYYYKAKNELG